MIFDSEELKELTRLIEIGNNVDLLKRMVENMNQLEKKIDSNYRMQEGMIRDLERRLADALRYY